MPCGPSFRFNIDDIDITITVETHLTGHVKMRRATLPLKTDAGGALEDWRHGRVSGWDRCRDQCAQGDTARRRRQPARRIRTAGDDVAAAGRLRGAESRRLDRRS